MRAVVISGSRDWGTDASEETERLKALVVEALKPYPPDSHYIVHGGCQGVDYTAGAVAKALGYQVKVYHADWARYKKPAGPIRNREMVDKEQPVVVLLVHPDLAQSKGTKDMLRYVTKKGIPFSLYEKTTTIG